MSDNIPFDVQMEIVKRVFSVKSVIQFRSVSKQWKSFIDSSDFIKGYGARHTHPHSHILSKIYGPYGEGQKYMHLVDKVQRSPFVVSHLLKQCHIRSDFGGVIGSSYGLSCLFAYNVDIGDYMLVIWNPSIGKSFGIALPRFMALDCSGKYSIGYGFGVCPVTSDPTVVEFLRARDMRHMPWHVRVFTLSSGVWNVIPSDKLPHQTIRFSKNSQVVIDKFIYWLAREGTYNNLIVVSFNLITHEFKVVNLPDTLKKVPLRLNFSVSFSVSFSLSELRGSLVVCKYKSFAREAEADVWVMGNDSSFRKLFTVCAPRIDLILGFKKNDETIFISRSQNENKRHRSVLYVYDPCSHQIKNLGISGEDDSFFMGSYKESLLLLDHLDSHIYQDNSDQNDDNYFDHLNYFCN